MKSEYLAIGVVLLVIMGILFLIIKPGNDKLGETMFDQKNTTTIPKLNVDNNSTRPPAAAVTQPINQQSQQSVKSKIYTAVLKTSQGDITVSLSANQTPNTVQNFVTLARKNFYNNTIFHRVIKGFMIQGGDPNGDGTGGPGYRFNDEPFKGEYTRGTVAMANAGPNTNGSQFFIMHQDYALPKNYVIFGKVVEGIDVVDKIAEAPVEPSATGEESKPVTPVVVSSVEIVEK